MSLTDTVILKCLSGTPIFLGGAVCAIYPPTLRSIVEVGYDTFLSHLNIINLEKPTAPNNKDGRDEFFEVVSELTLFEYFIFLTQVDIKMNQLIRDALYFFLHDTVSFSLEPCQIIVGKIDENRVIDESLFMEMREIIRYSCWLTEQSGIETTPQEDDSELVRGIREQMRINHEKLAHAKRVGQSEHIELSDLIASLTVGNCGLNIINIWDITYYAFHDQLKRMGWREQFDINNRAAMAGAKLKKNDLKHWIKSIQTK